MLGAWRIAFRDCFQRNFRGLASKAASKFAKKKRIPPKRLDLELLPTVAIVGRPNVGKSALFNRLGRRQLAVVYNTPESHVTRDYREGVGSLADLQFKMVDTSGLEPFMTSDSILARATRLTTDVLQRTDITLMLLDARDGVNQGDKELADWLRSNTQATIVLVANKAEKQGRAGIQNVGDAVSEASRLGFGEPVAISAETGEGMVDLYAALQPLVDTLVHRRKSDRAKTVAQAPAAIDEKLLEVGREAGMLNEEKAEEEEDDAAAPDLGPIKLAIVGVPNVGKSTLANLMLGRERSLTGPEPGLTRDAVHDRFQWQGRQVDLVDTAGWVRRARLVIDGVGGSVMEAAMAQAERSWNLAHVVALVLDGPQSLQGETLSRLELSLASKVVGEGRALLLIINKLDALQPPDRFKAVHAVEVAIEGKLPEVAGATCLGISALTREGVDQVMPAVAKAYDTWNMRIPTSRLNRWLLRLAEEYAGTSQGRDVMRVRYVTQVSTRPPTFVAFVTGADEFGSNSTRFMLNKLRGYFGFPGVPLRLTVRHKARRETEKPQPVNVWMARKAPLRRKRRKKRDVFEWLR